MFFKAARSGAWTQDPRKPTNLEDEEPEVFENYIRLVYFDDIRAYTKGEDLSMSTDAGHFKALIKVFLLVDRLIDFTAANQIIDRIIVYSKEANRFPRKKTRCPGLQRHHSRQPSPKAPARPGSQQHQRQFHEHRKRLKRLPQ